VADGKYQLRRDWIRYSLELAKLRRGVARRETHTDFAAIECDLQKKINAIEIAIVGHCVTEEGSGT
jgi:hypothetical protein